MTFFSHSTKLLSNSDLGEEKKQKQSKLSRSLTFVMRCTLSHVFVGK